MTLSQGGEIVKQRRRSKHIETPTALTEEKKSFLLAVVQRDRLTVGAGTLFTMRKRSAEKSAMVEGEKRENMKHAKGVEAEWRELRESGSARTAQKLEVRT